MSLAYSAAAVATAFLERIKIWATDHDTSGHEMDNGHNSANYDLSHLCTSSRVVVKKNMFFGVDTP